MYWFIVFSVGPRRCHIPKLVKKAQNVLTLSLIYGTETEKAYACLFWKKNHKFQQKVIFTGRQ